MHMNWTIPLVFNHKDHLIIAVERVTNSLNLTLHTPLTQDFDDLPQSLLSYYAASKSRAAACEKLLLEKPEGL